MQVLHRIGLWFTVSGAAVAGEGGFLFATFKGEQTPLSEQVYFAVSTNGRHWEALKGGEPVLISTLGEQGVRDPYLLRAPDARKFFLIATDLSIHRNGDWNRAVRRGSRSLVVWESTNLVHWAEPRLVRVAPDDAGCTWAPEAVYDESRGEYLVFWASKTGRDDFRKHRIWAAWTRDFVSFGEPFIYLERPWDVIDTTIVREGGRLYRFSKDEQHKAITLETGTSLLGEWTSVTNFTLGRLRGYEGPQCFQLKPATGDQSATWCLILDHYSRGAGYQPFVSEDPGSGQFQAGAGFVFPFRFRHGSVLPITGEELQRLRTAY